MSLQWARYVALLLVIAFSAGISSDAPEQIHISYTGDASEMMVSYVTRDSQDNSEDNRDPSPAVARYGTDPKSLDKRAQGKSFVFDTGDDELVINNVKLTDLEANTRYYYQVGSTNVSDVFSFSTNEEKLIFAVYGDMGYKNAVSLDRLIEEVKNGNYNAVLHVGDLAYDFYEEEGDTGDNFMNSIQPIATNVPYMVCPGNHEHKYNFSNYLNRFSNIEVGAGYSSGSDTNLWYSFDLGLIHFVAFDTEVYNYYSDPGQIQRQLNWLEADLEKANQNRDKRPWIVSLAHKSYFMSKTDFSRFGPLLHKYGVDLHLCGHSHNYQRHFPAYDGDVQKFSDTHVYDNPKYLTTIVAGSAGSKEKISHGLGPKETLVTSVFDYGYGHLQAVNKTHLHWTWENTGVYLESGVQDFLWIVQGQHGMRHY